MMSVPTLNINLILSRIRTKNKILLSESDAGRRQNLKKKLRFYQIVEKKSVSIFHIQISKQTIECRKTNSKFCN